MSRKASLDSVESANALITSHTFPWCRARLLHALGAAEEQGVLEEVLSELLDDREASKLRNGLRATGWAKS